MEFGYVVHLGVARVLASAMALEDILEGAMLRPLIQSNMKPIYLDYNATTPIDPGVRAAMLPYLGEQFRNPSRAHEYGR